MRPAWMLSTDSPDACINQAAPCSSAVLESSQPNCWRAGSLWNMWAGRIFCPMCRPRSRVRAKSLLPFRELGAKWRTICSGCLYSVRGNAIRPSVNFLVEEIILLFAGCANTSNSASNQHGYAECHQNGREEVTQVRQVIK